MDAINTVLTRCPRQDLLVLQVRGSADSNSRSVLHKKEHRAYHVGGKDTYRVVIGKPHEWF